MKNKRNILSPYVLWAIAHAHNTYEQKPPAENIHSTIGLYSDGSMKYNGVAAADLQDHLKFSEPKEVMERFARWVERNSIGKPIFISDNLAFDWQWINWYFHKFIGRNPFGFSGRRIGDLYCGMKKDAGLNSEWKKMYRQTRHTHHPVDDAKGNAEALLAFKSLGLKIRFD